MNKEEAQEFGLSPLTRGTRNIILRYIQPARFIPAGAGNTSERSADSTMQPVYPRWRGEHVARKRKGIIENGLSPLARGTREPHQVVDFAIRFIPAGAGNTELRLQAESQRAVYPRWRGEHEVEVLAGK